MNSIIFKRIKWLIEDEKFPLNDQGECFIDGPQVEGNIKDNYFSW